MRTGEPHSEFGAAVELAKRLFGAASAAIGLAEDGAWRDGEAAPDAAFRDHALLADEPLLVPDTQAEPHFARDPAIAAAGIRFYAGAPLIARDGRRIGVLSVLDQRPRPEIAPAAARHLGQLARLLVNEIELRSAQEQLVAELASRSLAETRLKLTNELTEAALAAPDFKAAIGICLELLAEHFGASCAFAHALGPRATRLATDAVYLAPGESALEKFLALVRQFALDSQDSFTGEAIIGQRLATVADLSTIDRRRYRLAAAACDHGMRSLFAVPCANAGMRCALTFLFRDPPEDMERLIETANSLSPKIRDLLARKQAEERIALLQSVVLHTSDAIMVCDAEPGEPLRIRYVNAAFVALTGYPAEAVIGQSPSMLRGPGTEEEALARLTAAVLHSEPFRIEMHLHRKDGTGFWAEIEAKPVKDAEGREHHWIAALRDCSERKQAEVALRGSEQALRLLAERQSALLNALPAYVALLDRSGRIASVNRSWHEFARALGRESSAGASYFEFLARNCAAGQETALAEGLAAVLEGRETEFSTDYACDVNGRRHWYRLAIAPVATVDGRGAVAVHIEVTSSKLAEEALRREQDFSELLIKSSVEGILVFDRDFRITLWNPGLSAITGVAAEDAVGRLAAEVLPQFASTPLERAMTGALEGHEASVYEQRYAVPATGREGFYEAYFSPLYNREREVIGGIGFLRETTERHRIEDALRQSQKMEAVGQLTGGIAHDFNNMLTVIAGNLELLEGKLANEPRLLRLVTSAALAASRAEKLTQQLLTFSRRQQLHPQPIDFNQIIIGMDDLLHRTVGESVEIRTLLSPELWPALADPNQIETALLNLALNARDAMPQGGTITIETGNIEIGTMHEELAPGAYAMLSVADTGQGMSEAVLARVFEPFFTTKEVGKGTGLGLAQVYGFVKQSAGHVKIDSRLGQGTTVRLYLPRAEGIANAASIAPMREQPYRGSETVLVVEDDHGVRDFAVSVLRELGYRVLEAAAGDVALDLLAEHDEVDLLFTDVVMPGRYNGADLARAARQLRADLRVLFTSGYTTRLLERDWSEEPVEFLRKPYRSLDLAQRVRAVLDGADQAAE